MSIPFPPSSSSSSSSSASLISSSPLQSSSRHPPTPSPSSSPPPACSSVPTQLQGRFTPLLQDVALAQVEEELDWVPPGDKCLSDYSQTTRYTTYTNVVPISLTQMMPQASSSLTSQEVNGPQQVALLMTMWLWSSPTGIDSPSSPSSSGTFIQCSGKDG